MGKGSTTSNTTVQSYQPTEQEIRLQGQAADYSEAVAPNALNLNNLAANLLKDSYGAIQVDYGKLTNDALGQVGAAQKGVAGLVNGQLPEEYQKNMEASIKRGVTNSMGGMLDSLGSRGVLNSSITDKGIAGINDSAANAMADAYNNNITTLSQLYGQQINSAGAGITTAAGGQEAAQNPALNLWNASLGLNSGATLGALQAMGGQGTTTATSTQKTSGGGGLLGGILGGLAGNAGLFGGPSCFTAETKVNIPEGSKEIRHMTVGDKVVCYDTDNNIDIEETVAETMTPHYTDVYTVVCDNNNFVSTTATQPLLDKDNNFLLVSDIKIGTELKCVGKVKSIVYSGERKVYDLKVSGNNNYYANGFIAKGGTNEWGGER